MRHLCWLKTIIKSCSKTWVSNKLKRVVYRNLRIKFYSSSKIRNSNNFKGMGRLNNKHHLPLMISKVKSKVTKGLHCNLKINRLVSWIFSKLRRSSSSWMRTLTWKTWWYYSSWARTCLRKNYNNCTTKWILSYKPKCENNFNLWIKTLKYKIK